ncbi:hypothetical protein JCM9279_007167 [Rhodotorula babjevae]
MQSPSHGRGAGPVPAGLQRSVPLALQFAPAVQAVVRKVRSVLAGVAPEHQEVAHSSKGRLERWEKEMLAEAVVREFVELPRTWEKERVLANVEKAGEHMAHTAQIGIVQTPTHADLFRTDSLENPPAWLLPLVAAAPSSRPHLARVHALRGSSPPPRPMLPPPLRDPLRIRDEDEQHERDDDEENEGGESWSGSTRATYELGGRRLDRRIGLRAAARYGIDPAAFARGY